MYAIEIVTQTRMAGNNENKKLDKVGTTARTKDLDIWHSYHSVRLINNI
jgi:hypothetical protein